MADSHELVRDIVPNALLKCWNILQRHSGQQEELLNTVRESKQVEAICQVMLSACVDLDPRECPEVGYLHQFPNSLSRGSSGHELTGDMVCFSTTSTNPASTNHFRKLTAALKSLPILFPASKQ